ncbi:hypothetical protein [Alcaligenes sp. WGS1538]|uniref:hypothetical protein n=1 Tax=Alcaligenes sp. WGS1538 TaxID=3366811 RepID=UPI00372D6EB4
MDEQRKWLFQFAAVELLFRFHEENLVGCLESVCHEQGEGTGAAKKKQAPEGACLA